MRLMRIGEKLMQTSSRYDQAVIDLISQAFVRLLGPHLVTDEPEKPGTSRTRDFAWAM